MYDILLGKQKGLVFPVMCNAHVKIDYSDNVPDLNYGIWEHTGSFTFESIITPYDINGVGQLSAQARHTPRQTKKVMPSVLYSQNAGTGGQNQSELYLPLAKASTITRFTHEMRIFSSTNYYISLVNSTTHNENQPAEYKIKVGVKLGGVDYTMITNDAVITATEGVGWRLGSAPYTTLEGFDENGRIKYIHAGTTDANSSGTTINVDSTTKFHQFQEVFTRDGFNFTSLGTIASSGINAGVSFVLDSAPSSPLSSGVKIFIPAFKEPAYINNQFHIAFSFTQRKNSVGRIFLNGILVKEQEFSSGSAVFSMASEDLFIGASNNQGVGADSAGLNKQFMGELHEICMTSDIRKKFLTNTLLPNSDSTLMYFKFEEGDL